MMCAVLLTERDSGDQHECRKPAEWLVNRIPMCDAHKWEFGREDLIETIEPLEAPRADGKGRADG